MLAAQAAARRRAQAQKDGQGNQKQQTKRRTGDSRLFGVVHLDEPLDLHGLGTTWREKFGSFFLVLMILKEQLTGARRMVQSIVFFVYLGLFTSVSLQALNGEKWFDHHSAIRRAVSEREWNFTDSQIPKFLNDVQTTEDFWAWVRGPFVHNVIPRNDDLSNWERGTNRTGYFNMHLKLLGPVRLRQVRVRSDSCAVSDGVALARGETTDSLALTEDFQAQHALYTDEMTLGAYVASCSNREPTPGCGDGAGGIDDPHRGQVGQVSGCYTEVTDITEARDPFGPLTNISGDNRSTWLWQSAQDLNEGSYFGRSSEWYPGSGYTFFLDPDFEAAADGLKTLHENAWIDLSTRVVFLDFMVYSPNVGFLTLVKVSVEFRPGGKTLPFVLLRSVKVNQILLNDRSSRDLAPEVLVLVFVIFYMMYEIWDMWRTGPKYLLNGWHYLAIANYLVFLAGFGMRMTPYAEVRDLGFPPEPGTYINYDHTFWASQQWRNCLAVNCVLVWIRAFQHLSFIPYMTRLVTILVNAMAPLMTVVVVFILCLFAYAVAFLLAFGHGVHEFRNLSMALINTFRTLRGPDYFDDLWEENRLLGPFFFFSWTIIGAFVVINLFVVVLLDSIGALDSFNMATFYNNVVRAYTMLFGGGKKTVADAQQNDPNAPQYRASSQDVLASAGAKWASTKSLQPLQSTQSMQSVQREVSTAGEEDKGEHGIPELLRLLVGAGKQDTAMVEITEERFAAMEKNVQQVNRIVQDLVRAREPQREGLGTAGTRPGTEKSGRRTADKQQPRSSAKLGP